MEQKTILFQIHFRVQGTEQLYLYILDHGTEECLVLQSLDQGHWSAAYSTSNPKEIYYQYAIQYENQTIEREFGKYRRLILSAEHQYYSIIDHWKSRYKNENVFQSSAFSKVIFKRSAKRSKKKSVSSNMEISVLEAKIPKNLILGICGNIKPLGNWNTPVLLDDSEFPIWKTQFDVSGSLQSFEYKFVLCDPSDGRIIHWEDGENRHCKVALPKESKGKIIIQDEDTRFSKNIWKGSGVAVPVFSLRSENGFGIGEFTDLKLMIDLAEKLDMQFVQILPVNDTIANFDWKDSYPYAAISVYALHPLYVNLEKIAPFKNNKDQQAYKRDLKKLNKSKSIEFLEVRKKKLEYLEILFNDHFQEIEKKSDYKKFNRDNEHWLFPYALFCALRDRNQSPHFSRWKGFEVYDEKAMKKALKSDLKLAGKVSFYRFIQYFAHKQLLEAKHYGQSKGIVLKGDLPIGIFRYSSDAWMAPDLYNMNQQAGAPPDVYSQLGQNWKFPTYNWEMMESNGFAWWKARMKKLNEYFDALRIDHILGFFRIWQIPLNQVQGTMGLFNSRMPYSIDELQNFGLYGDLQRFTKPFIRSYYLHQLFGEDTETIKSQFLFEMYEGALSLKEEFNDQQKITRFIQQSENEIFSKYEDKILSLVSEVLLIEEPGSEGLYYNPRITLHSTFHYQSLDDYLKNCFNAIYADYYFNRHENYWREQAERKLPALIYSTDMLICGEDLGMIPASVPAIMDKYNILSLEIQRMPKGNEAFGIPAHFPYYSVCSPSSHDMSNIRAWWEGNPEVAQRYYNEHLWKHGKAPEECNVEIVEAIINDHLHGNSMLAIFPIQDLLGLDEDMRNPDPYIEQVNDPSNPNQRWEYRMHLSLEHILEQKEFIHRVLQLIKNSGRA